MAHPASLAAARTFARRNAAVLGVVLLAMVLAYGFALTSFSLSVDEDTGFYLDWTDNWIRQGRPIVPLMKFAVGDTLPLPFVNLALALAILFVAGVMWAFILTQAARPARIGRAGVLVFLIVFTTLPLNAYYLAWNTFNIEVSLAWVWAAASVWLSWLWAVQGRGWPTLLASVAAAVMAVLTYQDFSFAIIAGVLLVEVAHRLGSRRHHTTRAALRQTVLLLLPTVVALAVAALVSLLIVERGGHIEGIIGWGSADPLELVSRVLQRVRSFATGTGFAGGWVLIPTIAAGVVLIVLVANRGRRERQWYSLALLLLISVLPFGLSLAVGRPLPNRALQALVLVAASVWFLLPLVIHARKQLGPVLLVIAAAFTMWNAGIITTSFLAEHQTYEADRAIAHEIGRRLVLAGWNGTETVPIMTVGPRRQGPLELTGSHEVFGFSLFNGVDGRRSPGFMWLMGYPVRPASEAEAAAARDRSTSMPVWPAEGSVAFQDGLAIVKFSELTEVPAEIS